MYRIYDTTEAIKRIQSYLATIEDSGALITPNGIYDEKTRNSVEKFQQTNGIPVTASVDYITFEELFRQYGLSKERDRVFRLYGSFINFPVLPGDYSESLLHINRTMSKLLDYYGQPHNLSDSNYYSSATSSAVKLLRKIYRLEDIDMIDELLYSALIRDHDSLFTKRSNSFRRE